MDQHGADQASVVVAIALAAGMVAQAIARHARLPGIVLLLAAGILLGPDVLGIVDPDQLGSGLQVVVGFAVAVILFEGGMNLNLKRLRREALVIRRLLTVGALITAVGGGLASAYFMNWDWRLAAAFGSLVIVTGPTVITPLLRRIKVKHTVSTILEAEGVLIDAIGAVLAVVTIEVVLVPLESSLVAGLVDVVSRMAFGLVAGALGGFLLAMILRFDKIVPEGLDNVFTLSLVLALFQLSNLFMPESGIVTVTAAGMVVGNVPTKVQRDLLEFKEQLTVMLIGMLFVLLAADVRITQVIDLGWPAVATVGCLMLVVRPLNIGFSTWGSSLTRREKVFLSWLAPRGVVAAAVASLFAQRFAAAGFEGGKDLQALVFVVIAATVVIQGLTGGFVAQALGLRRPSNVGYAILGANDLGLTLGRLLRMADEEVLFMDSSPAACKLAEEDGFRVVYGNALHERTLLRARLDEKAGCVAVTPNEEVNLLFARTASEECSVPRVIIAVRRDRSMVTPNIVAGSGANVLFGIPRDVETWVLRLRRGLSVIESWRIEDKPARPEGDGSVFEFPKYVLPLVLQRGKVGYPVHSGLDLRKGDILHCAIHTEQEELAHEWLGGRRWARVERLNKDAPVMGVGA